MGAAAAQSGIRGGGLAAAGAGAVERYALRRAALVGVIHESFVDKVAAMGVPEDRIRLVRNWSHVRGPSRPREEMRARLGWRPGQTVLLHAGNMGIKQGLDVLVETARMAPEVRVVLMGDGNQREHLRSLAGGLPNLDFMPPAESAEFPDVLGAADVLLVTQRGSVRDMSLPSKLTSYFAAGRPVIASVATDSGTAQEVARSGAGVVVPAESAADLLAAVRTLTADPARLTALAAAGPVYAATHLTREAGLARIDALLEEALTAPPAARKEMGSPAVSPAAGPTDGESASAPAAAADDRGGLPPRPAVAPTGSAAELAPAEGESGLPPRPAGVPVEQSAAESLASEGEPVVPPRPVAAPAESAAPEVTPGVPPRPAAPPAELPAAEGESVLPSRPVVAPVEPAVEQSAAGSSASEGESVLPPRPAAAPAELPAVEGESGSGLRPVPPTGSPVEPAAGSAVPEGGLVLPPRPAVAPAEMPAPDGELVVPPRPVVPPVPAAPLVPVVPPVPAVPPVPVAEPVVPAVSEEGDGGAGGVAKGEQGAVDGAVDGAGSAGGADGAEGAAPEGESAGSGDGTGANGDDGDTGAAAAHAGRGAVGAERGVKEGVGQ